MPSPAHRHRQNPLPFRQRGIGLIEVLIAAFIFAIGLLGLARLETANFRNNHGAQLRSQAMALAYDIIDRMRANRERALEGDYDIDIGDDAPSGTTVAATDLQEWKAGLADVLPAGDGSVTRAVAGPVTRFTVIVQWDDSRSEEDPLQFAINTEL
ncbi:MAG: type IV pilus modification protein PilV [Pseudomonadales bacterium]|nr:type IV pilus modification protein PilV [Pseudomonadales bacterium]